MQQAASRLQTCCHLHQEPLAQEENWRGLDHWGSWGLVRRAGPFPDHSLRSLGPPLPPPAARWPSSVIASPEQAPSAPQTALPADPVALADMEAATLAVVRASRPTFRSSRRWRPRARPLLQAPPRRSFYTSRAPPCPCRSAHDKLAFAVHAFLLSEGFKLVATGVAAEDESAGAPLPPPLPHAAAAASARICALGCWPPDVHFCTCGPGPGSYLPCCHATRPLSAAWS